ncbi:MAG: ATP-binding cassette domain-containing protein [Pseudomonadota bacterium]
MTLKLDPPARGESATWPAGLFAPGTLRLEPGEHVAVLGRSGTGKSTLLRALAGSVATDGWARIEYLGLAAGTPPRTALMAQTSALLPWFSVRDNVMLGDKLRGETPDHTRGEKLLERVGLAGLGDHAPTTLSGGMAQRVALARTLYEQAELLLLDEPFSALDAITRRQMQGLTAEETADRARLLVTHDPDEAWRLGTRIILLEGNPTRIVPFDRSRGIDALWQAVLAEDGDARSARRHLRPKEENAPQNGAQDAA